jgi:hypothetical protein
MRAIIKVFTVRIYLAFVCHFLLIICSCKNYKAPQQQFEKLHQRLEREATDSLKKYGKENYIDSAYWYFYVYFGSAIIKRCGAADIDAILPKAQTRRIIYQDLALTKVRMIPESSYVYISVTPLLQDSILSCNMVEGQELPQELMFNYATKQFIQFVYDENSWLKVQDIHPLIDYNQGLRKIIEKDNLDPHAKFKRLLSKVSRH